MSYIAKAVERLKPYTASICEDLQNQMIPSFVEGIISRRSKYIFDSKVYRSANKYQLVYQANCLPIRSGKGHTSKVIDTKILDLINDNRIDPILLFINKKFVKWSNITIRCDYKNTYILIDNQAVLPDYTIDILRIPFPVSYNETGTISTSDIFRFDTDGFLGNTPVTCISMTNPNILYKSGKQFTDTNLLLDMDIPSKYKLTPKNFIAFTNGKLDKDVAVSVSPCNYTSIVFSEGTDFVYKVFYNTTVSYDKNMIEEPENEEYVKDKIHAYLTGNGEEFLLHEMDENFNFSMDKTKTYEQNINDAVDYIKGYNVGLLKDLVFDNISTTQLTGYQLLNTTTISGGRVYLERYTHAMRDTFVIVYRNGLLYEKYSTILYDLQGYSMELSDDISDDDIFEFVYYKNVNNSIISGICANTMTISPSLFDMDSLRITCSATDNNTFGISSTQYTNYEVPFEKDGNTVNIYNSFYYGKPIRFSSTRQFRYCHIDIPMSAIKAKLPEDFKMCIDLSKFMVFLNGRKINNGFQITIPKEDNPFTDIWFYSNTALKESDSLDIFYVSDDMYEDTIPQLYGLEQYVYTSPGVLTYQIPVPYNNFFDMGNYMNMVDGYGNILTDGKEVTVDYNAKTFTFNYESMTPKDNYTIDDSAYADTINSVSSFLNQIDEIFDYEYSAYRTFDDTEIMLDKLYYTNKLSVIEEAKSLSYDLFQEDTVLLNLFNKMIDDCYEGPTKIDWSLRSGLLDMFKIIHINNIIDEFINSIIDMMSKVDIPNSSHYLLYSTDEDILDLVKAKFDMLFYDQPTSIKNIFYKIIQNSSTADVTTATDLDHLCLRTDLAMIFNIIPKIIKFEFVNNTDTGLKSTGYVLIENINDGLLLNRDNIFIFINGKKVPVSNIQNISSRLMKITDNIGSMNDFTIIRHATPLNVFTTDDTAMSKYDQIISSCGFDILNDLYSTYNDISTSETNAFKYDLMLEGIMNDIIRDHYIAHTDGEVFVFNYEKNPYLNTDSTGNTVISAMDATNATNIIDNEDDEWNLNNT